MSATTGPPGREPTGTPTYEIRVAGHLDDRWAATLGGHALARLADGTTTLTVEGVDQARLHGVLARIRDLGVPLLAVRTMQPGCNPPRGLPAGGVLGGVRPPTARRTP